MTLYFQRVEDSELFATISEIRKISPPEEALIMAAKVEEI